MAARKLMLGLAASALAGCMVGPDYQRPEVAMPAAYRAHLNATTSQVDGPWWGQFGSPTLSSLVKEGLANNLDLQRATARIEQFRGQLRTVRAGLFPQLGGGAQGPSGHGLTSSSVRRWLGLMEWATSTRLASMPAGRSTSGASCVARAKRQARNCSVRNTPSAAWR